MASLKALLFAFCGCLCGSLAAEDTTILLQFDSAQVHAPGVPLELELFEESEGWPSFANDIWDTVKDSVSDVTGNLGDVAKAVQEGDLKGLLFNKSMETAAVVMAQALSAALVTVDNATKKLRGRTSAQKQQLLQMIDNTSAVDVLNATLLSALGNYGKVRDTLSVAGSMIGSSFKRAGQEGLATIFRAQYDNAMTMVDEYVEGLKNATNDLAVLGGWRDMAVERVKPLLSEHLRNADGYFQAAAARVPVFAASITNAFQSAVDQTLDALPEASDRVQEAFRLVTNNVSDIVFQLRSSSRELTQAGHNVVANVAKGYNISMPKWSVTLPTLPPAPVLIPPTTAAPQPPAQQPAEQPAEEPAAVPEQPAQQPEQQVPAQPAQPAKPPNSGVARTSGAAAVLLALAALAQ